MIYSITSELNFALCDQNINQDIQLSPGCLLGTVVGDGRLDGVFGEHRAVNLDGRKIELFDDGRIFDRRGLCETLALKPLGRE